MVSDTIPTRMPQARSTLFLIALPICVVVALWGILDPDELVRTAGVITTTIFRALDWFYMALILFFLGLSVWLALGPHGRLKLGSPDDTPEFSTLSWLSMLFAAGMGAGLLYWGVAEPLLHFTQAPGDTPGTAAAARHALVMTIFHWGIHAWAVYCVAALILAYFGFRRQEPYLPGAPIRSTLSGRWVDAVAWLADLLAILAVALGVAGAIGMGVFQLQSGLHIVAGVSPSSPLVSVIILVLIVLSYLTSAATGLNKGIKILSNINMGLAVILMLFIAVAGPTGALLRGFVSAVGDYTSSLFPLSFQLYPYQSPAVSAWFHSWTLTYFIWWIAWAPFVGVFIARISRGRTIREFVMGVLVVPTAFTILWFSIFGGMGLHEELLGAGGMGELVRQDISTALFSLFDRLPGSILLSVIGLILVFIFVITSIDSATFVLGMLTSQGSMNPPVRRKIAWGLTLGGLGAALMFSGSPAAVKAVSVVAALPFTLVLILQVVALFRALAQDAVAENNP